MLRRCDRYLLREMVGPFFLALAGLVLFILLNIILSLSDLMVDRGIGMLTLLRLVALKMPSLLVIAVPTGVLLGGIAGLFGGWRDEVIMRVTDVFLAFPSLILAMSFSAALGPSLFNAMIALSIVWWPLYTRLIRGQALSVREMSYVEAARSRGAGNWFLVRRHILPNCLSPILVTFTQRPAFR